MSLEDRIGKLEDLDAIRALASRYSLAVDDHDFRALAGVFSRDAAYGWHGQEPGVTGCEAVVALLRGRLEAGGPSFHVNHDHLIDWRPDGTASGIVCAHAEACPGGRQLVFAIRYHDDYAREDGVWRIARRSLAFLYIVSPEDYPGILMDKARLRHVDPARSAHWPAYAS